MGTIIDYVPTKEEIESQKSDSFSGIDARDACGDGTEEYRHINPLVTWKQHPVLYFIDSTISTSALQQAVVQSFEEFNNHAGFQLYLRTFNRSEAKVIVSMGVIDSRGGTLARAQWWFRSSTNEITNATITFDSNDNWGALAQDNCGSTGNIFDMANVGTHEVGHISGLSHAPTDQLQTMYASTSPGKTLGRTLGRGDILGFHTAYDITPDEENNPPVAVSFGVETDINKQVTVNMQGSDPDGDDIEFHITQFPIDGQLKDKIQNRVTYIPNTDFSGTDRFMYLVADSRSAQSNVATVTIKVNKPDEPNKPPVVQDLNLAVEENRFLREDLKGEDPENDDLVFSIVTQPTNGTARIIGDNRLLYIPERNFEGMDKLTYKAKDSKGAESNVATITIKVGDVIPPPPDNNPPVVQEEPETFEVHKNKSVEGMLIATDPDDDPVTFLIVEQPKNGTVKFENADEDSVDAVYTPNKDYVGDDKFTYQAADDKGAKSNIGTVIVKVIEPPPKTHEFTEAEIEEINTLQAVYEEAKRTGDQAAIDKAREELQEYVIDLIIEKHTP